MNRFVLLPLLVLLLCSCDEPTFTPGTSVQDRRDFSLQQVKDRNQSPRTFPFGLDTRETQSCIESTSIESLIEGPVPCVAFRVESNDGIVAIGVRWISAGPDIDGFQFSYADQRPAVFVPINPVDAASNVIEAERAVIFFGSVRDADLNELEIELDLRAVESVVIVDTDGDPSVRLIVVDPP